MRMRGAEKQRTNTHTHTHAHTHTHTRTHAHTHRSKAVHALSKQPLPPVTLELPLSRRHVVRDGVSGDVAHRVLCLGVAGDLGTDHDRELDLEVEARDEARVEEDRRPRRVDRRGEL